MLGGCSHPPQRLGPLAPSCPHTLTLVGLLSSAPAPVPINATHAHPSAAHAHTGGHQASPGSASHLQATSASATSVSFESVFTDEEEKLSDYESGGYHPVRIGDVYGPNDRYQIVRKLGWGHFSTVWSALPLVLEVEVASADDMHALGQAGT